MSKQLPAFMLRAVVQRVSYGQVFAAGSHRGSIKQGLLVLFGVGWTPGCDRTFASPVRDSDGEPRVDWNQADLSAASTDLAKLVQKILGLRTFSDSEGKMNQSLRDTNGCVALVSQFTLFADLGKGTRPGFQNAAPPDVAQRLYDEMCLLLAQELGPDRFVSGVFGAEMALEFVNDGPVTYVIDIRNGKVLGLP